MSNSSKKRGSKEYSFSKPLTTGEVARLCHVSTVTVRNWIKVGKLEAYTLPGGHYRITRGDFKAFLRRYSIPVPEERQMPPENS